MGRNIWIKQPRKEDGDFLDDSSGLTPGDSGVTAPGGGNATREPREINIGGKATIRMGKGDHLVIQTPGGGGWGSVNEGEGGQGEENDGAIASVLTKAKTAVEWAARGSFAERAAAQAGF